MSRPVPLTIVHRPVRISNTLVVQPAIALGPLLQSATTAGRIRELFPDIKDPQIHYELPEGAETTQKARDMTPEQFYDLGGILRVASDVSVKVYSPKNLNIAKNVQDESSYESVTLQSPKPRDPGIDNAGVMKYISQLREEMASERAALLTRIDSQQATFLAKIDSQDAKINSLSKKVEILAGFQPLNLRILINIAYRTSKQKGFTHHGKADFLTGSEELTNPTKEFFKQALSSGTISKIILASHYTHMGWIAQTIQYLSDESDAGPYQELFTYCFGAPIQEKLDSTEVLNDLTSE
ncbi:hypothetical protein TWF788_008164 [Orbilia oligospora]|uniref:Uncharacterized protein n=1 Tax=Orbilia oligospora TaxID=2813651 RepID=A0A7C8U3R4_ORBOL|nr:hypothetical protein TWF788_008164 [Orbilia oligospora]